MNTGEQAALLVFACIVTLCGAFARSLPPGKLQRMCAWVGIFAVPKTAKTGQAEDGGAFESALDALGDTLTPDQVSRVIAVTNVNKLTETQYAALVRVIMKSTELRAQPFAPRFDPDETLPAA